MRIDPDDLRDANVLRYYKLIRKWYAKQYDIPEPELECLIALDCKKYFTFDEYKDAVSILNWKRSRWTDFKDRGIIKVWRKGKNGSKGYKTLYTITPKYKQAIESMYRVMLGREKIPMGKVSVIYDADTYTHKVMNRAIDKMNKDQDRIINRK